MEFTNHDLRTISRVGKALWANPEDSIQNTRDTVSSVTLLSLPREKSLERTLTALLEKVEKQSENTIAKGAHIPFYRLLSEERFILATLHYTSWSYTKVGEILGLNEKQVGEISWKARVHLASLQSQFVHPAGPSKPTPNCPEYDPWNPWTQKFMDDDFSTQQRLFLQNHMMACHSCREALNRCRDLYYLVESQIPNFQTANDLNLTVSYLEGAVRSMVELQTRRTTMESLREFFNYRDVQAALVLLTVVLLYKAVF